MQDNQALQAGTSHYLGQNFARAFDVRFQTEQGEHELRPQHLVGRVHAAGRRPHHDARGRHGAGAAPPARADQAVVVPIWRDDEQQADGVRGLPSGRYAVLKSVRRPGPRGRARGHEPRRQVLRVGAQGRAAPRSRSDRATWRKQQVMAVRRFTPEGDERKTLSWARPTSRRPSPAGSTRCRTSCLEPALQRRAGQHDTGPGGLRSVPRADREGEGGFVFAGWCGSEACEQRGQGGHEAPPSASSPAKSFAPITCPGAAWCAERSPSDEALRARAY